MMLKTTYDDAEIAKNRVLSSSISVYQELMGHKLLQFDPWIRQLKAFCEDEKLDMIQEQFFDPKIHRDIFILTLKLYSFVATIIISYLIMDNCSPDNVKTLMNCLCDPEANIGAQLWVAIAVKGDL